MNPNIRRSHIQTIRCGVPAHRSAVVGKLYPTDHGYTLVLSGTGPVAAPSSMFHAPWGRHTEEIAHLKIGEGITEIGASAFSSLRNLTSAELPSTLLRIYSEAFRGCRELHSMHFPDRLEYIGPAAFYRCLTLRSVSFGTGLRVIESEAFKGCAQLEQALFPEHTRKIGGSAFEGCLALSELQLPKDITRIYPNTFRLCSNLRQVAIPQKVCSIEDQAFAKCSSLEILNLQRAENLRLLHASSFSNCLSLKKILINASQRQLVLYHFPTCSKLIETGVS